MTLDDIRNNVDFSAYEEQQYQQEQQQQGGYVPQSAMVPHGQGFNPFAPRVNNSWDAVMADRLITIVIPPGYKEGDVWITDPKVMEQMSLTSLSAAAQADFEDEVYRIQMHAVGELNRHSTETRQRRLLARFALSKSRIDVTPDFGMNVNERQSWQTSRQILDQRITQPAPQRPQGFFATIASELTRQ